MAARFQFRLEALLRVRRSLEEEAKRHFSRVVALRDQAQTRVAELREAHRLAVEGRRIPLRQAVDLNKLKDTERFLVMLERRTRQAEDALALAEARMEEARQALLKRHQDHLILVRLKERRQEQHAQEVLREEIRDMDEIAVLRYHITHPDASNQ